MSRAPSVPNWRICVAPMLDWTDRHFRFFMRLITRHTLLYTEMITTAAILFGDREKLLGHSPQEHPVALQIAGNDPVELAECARIGEEWQYCEINLNLGCPSDRVQQGNFGAALMRQPRLVARCIAAMKKATSLPVTAKHRLGVDDLDSYEYLRDFVWRLIDAGCDRLIIHARKAWLQGLNPKANRRIPPLRYDLVYRLKEDFPDQIFVINGGITRLEDALQHLQHVDGVMIGRAAYDNPYLFAAADERIFGDPTPVRSRQEIVEQMIPYIEEWQRRGLRPKRIIRHMFGLFSFRPGARAWRRYLSEYAHLELPPAEVLRNALKKVPEWVRTESPQHLPAPASPKFSA